MSTGALDCGILTLMVHSIRTQRQDIPSSLSATTTFQMRWLAVKNDFNKSSDGIFALIFDVTTTPDLNSVMYHNTERAVSGYFLPPARPSTQNLRCVFVKFFEDLLKKKFMEMAAI